MENYTAKLEKYWLWGFLVLAIALVLAIPLIFVPWIKSIDFGKETSVIANYENLPQYISGITAHFLSLVTVVLLWKTYQSQKKELKQAETLTKQQLFTTTFFELLKLFEAVSVKTSYDDNKNSLLVLLKDSSTQTVADHPQYYDTIDNPSGYPPIDIFNYEALANDCIKNNEPFQFFHELLKLIDDYRKIVDESIYHNILRAKITKNALLCLMLYAITMEKTGSMKKLLHEHNYSDSLSDNEYKLLKQKLQS